MKKKRSKRKNLNEFNIINPNAAGIDISSKDYVVSISEDRCKKNIRTFGTFACDLKAIAPWILSCRIETVAMESAGVYWKQLFMVLQEYGLEVFFSIHDMSKMLRAKKQMKTMHTGLCVYTPAVY